MSDIPTMPQGDFNMPPGVSASDIPGNECDHPEHDHGICLDCGEDITNDLVSKSEAQSEGDR